MELWEPYERYSNPHRVIAPPQEGWQEELKACRDFITNAVEWGLFVEFRGKLNRLLCTDESHLFNIDHESRVMASFKPSEVRELNACLKRVIRAKTMQFSPLSTKRAVLFQRAQDALGDLLIGNKRDAWRIDSFPKPDALD